MHVSSHLYTDVNSSYSMQAEQLPLFYKNKGFPRATLNKRSNRIQVHEFHGGKQTSSVYLKFRENTLS